MQTENNLQRFIKAQEVHYQQALAEIKNGRKQSHWMWYIFPQIQGLGFSETSKFYAIKDIDEDITTFKNFLNDSYYADDFYVQSFINYTLTVLNDLALTDHLQTIPKILKEMWQVLGESGIAFRKSILLIM